MSTLTRKKLLTAEEFLLLSDPEDGRQQELVRGEVIAMPPPGGLHGVCCSNANREISVYVKSRGLGTVTCNDTGFITERGPDTVRGPDIAFWSRARLPEVPAGYIEVAPDLLVEVLSPGNTAAKISVKLREYFDKGVRQVWVISPADRTLTIYRSLQDAQVLHESASVNGEEVLPGFTCRVSEFLP